MTIHVYTSFSFSYLNRARVLSRSVKAEHPDWVFWAFICDKPPANFDSKILQEFFDHVVFVEDLYKVETESWVFRHNVIEACTGIKGRALQHLLAQHDCEFVIYLDPDIAVVNSLDPLLEKLKCFSIVLTPHQIDPETDLMGIMDNEVASLNYGVFNLGFLAVRNDNETTRFAKWWTDRLDNLCHDRTDIGIFVDQKWCNLIPCFFDNVHILRDPGYNVASWNLSNRKFWFHNDGTLMVNDVVLRFYHFTKLGPVGRVMTQRYAKDNVEVYELWKWYETQIKLNTIDQISSKWWHYGTFENGIKIPQSVRRLYRDRKDLQSTFPEPRKDGENSFLSWLKAEEISL